MLSARWSEGGIEVVEVEPGPVPQGWARLRVTGCGICGSDLHLYRGMQARALAPTEYATPGHEIAGIIDDGPAGSHDAVYAVEPWVNCRTCAPCLRGDTVLCDEGQLLGISAGGGLAELVDVPPRLLHPVPDGVGEGLASMAEPWAVAVRAVHKARLTEVDDNLLVLGGGNIGLLCGIAARDRVARVGITCRYPHQAALARQFGLEPLDIGSADLDRWCETHGPTAVIETVGGSADTMAEAIRCARKGGRIVVVGVFDQPRPTDYRELVLKELEVVGSFIYGTVGSGSEFGAAVGRMAAITDELAALQTHQFTLAEAAEAFRTADDKSSLAVKVTIEPGVEPPAPTSAPVRVDVSKPLPFGGMADRSFADDDIQRYLAGKDVAILAMLTESGGPLATPMWFVNDEQELAMVSVGDLAKIRYLERDPRVSVVVEGGERGAGDCVVLGGDVRFLDGDERLAWGRRFHAKYSPQVDRLWGGSDIPDNRRVFCFAPRVVSAFGL